MHPRRTVASTTAWAWLVLILFAHCRRDTGSSPTPTSPGMTSPGPTMPLPGMTPMPAPPGMTPPVSPEGPTTPPTAPDPMPPPVPTPPAGPTRGAFTIHLILHAIGEERYEVVPNPDGTRTLTTTLDLADRGNRRTTTATLITTKEDRPLKLDVKGGTPVVADFVTGTTTIGGRSLTNTEPTRAEGAAVFGASPFALQMAMMRTWRARGEPERLSIVSTNPRAEPIEIARVGQDVITIDKRSVTLERYTVNNLMFGREILWTTTDGELAAAMTFAGGLPMEAVRKDLTPALPELYRAGVAQQIANLEAIGRAVRPSHRGAFAITGTTIIDATDGPPIADAVVIVRDGRIVAAGPKATTPIPPDMTTIDAKGQTLMPGLWEMHTHASGIEFGPALLAAGITTARDCGGELDFLVAARDAIAQQEAVGPRLLLAGLIDAGGDRAFGHVTAETPAEARAAVTRYHQQGFQQIKLYTFLSGEVVSAISAEAHRLGMTVTGHVPRSLSTIAGIEARMDHLNHLTPVMNMLRNPGGDGSIDFQSETAQAAVKFLLAHKTVVDPTASWGEMASHSREVDVASFEPGILTAPAVIDAKFRGMGGNTTAEQMKSRMAQTLAVIGGLHRAGVPIVAGSDTGLVGHGLHRELELYVQAGMTPLEAIKAATIVSARAMGLDRDSGTVEAGKRADLILVDGNPLEDIRQTRRVTRVIANGRVYDADALWRSVGFRGR
jgi:imidazolonepropionase-like amidohydrolase